MQTTLLEILKKSLIGKKLRHKNAYDRMVVLEIEDIKTTPFSGDLEIRVYFVDGSNIQIYHEQILDVIEDVTFGQYIPPPPKPPKDRLLIEGQEPEKP